jgi:hypothetical protein
MRDCSNRVSHPSQVRSMPPSESLRTLVSAARKGAKTGAKTADATTPAVNARTGAAAALEKVIIPFGPRVSQLRCSAKLLNAVKLAQTA